jgi:hypothetical protein
MNFLNPAGQVADHRKATGRYRAIENHARVFWEITCPSEPEIDSMRAELARLVEEWNKAIEASPPLFESLWRRAGLQYGGAASESGRNRARASTRDQYHAEK